VLAGAVVLRPKLRVGFEAEAPKRDILPKTGREELTNGSRMGVLLTCANNCQEVVVELKFKTRCAVEL
jgi:hypothetical protein